MKVLSEKEFLKKLCSFPHRKTPSEFGDKAAEFISREIKKIGLEPKAEVIKSTKFSIFWYDLLHFIFIFLSMLFFFLKPDIIFFLIFLLLSASLVSYWLRKPHLLSFLSIVSGKSKNILVKIPSRGKKKKRFILSAHYDTAHQCLFLNPMIAGNLAKAVGGVVEKFPLGLRSIMFLPNIALGYTLAFMISLLLGFSSSWLQALELVALAIFFIAILFMFQICTSPYVPGAFDNGGGVAVLYGLAKKIKKSPFKSIEIWFLFNSSEENNLVGIKDFLDRHESNFDKETTFFINFDGIGEEILHYITAEGDFLGVKHPDDPFLKSLAGLLDNYPQFKKVTPFFLPVSSDAREIIDRNFRCLTILSTNKDGYYPHYHQLTDTFDKINMDNIYLAEKFSYELLEKIDFV
jgi:hypothetical protein